MPSKRNPAQPPSVPVRGSPAPEQRRATAARLQMADIARLAGVSVSTVSRALAGSPLINAETRERVAQLARSLNYTINVGAQNLRLRQNRTIAVIVPFDPLTHQHLSDPFFLSLIGSVADALTEQGYELLLSRVPASQLDRAAGIVEGGRAAGIVMVGQWEQHDQLNSMAVRGIPLVVWGAGLPGQLYATVGTDNTLGGQLAVSHLVQRGARRIAFFGDTRLPEIAQRHQGYQQALARGGLVADPALLRVVPFEHAAIEREVQRFCESGVPFDAIFSASDLMAMTVISGLRRQGLQVPRDVLVAGYDDIELAQHFHPPLTTVQQPIREAGLALVSLLLAQLHGGKAQPVLLPTKLQPRESSQR
jgi:DNA-binding LacI/PurR family transcriptional regulator